MHRVACHEHGTALSGFLPASWDHLGCQSWDHPARLAGGSSVRSLIAASCCRRGGRAVGFREVSVVEVREVLRAWLEGSGLRKVAERAGVDRKTARRYVEAPRRRGWLATAGSRRSPTSWSGGGGGGPAGPAERARRVVGGAARPRGADPGLGVRRRVDGPRDPLSIVKIEELLARQGVRVPYRTLHRFAVERCGFRVGSTTVRVVDGEPGVECQIDFAQMGLLRRPGDRATAQGARADLHRRGVAAHVRVVDLLPDPGRGDRRLRGGVGVLRRGVQGAGPGQPEAGGHRRRRGQPAAVGGLVGLRPARRVRHRPGAGPLASGQAAGRAGGAVRPRQLLGRGDVHRPGRRPEPGSRRGAASGPGCGSTAPPSRGRPRCSPSSKPPACCRFREPYDVCRCSPG